MLCGQDLCYDLEVSTEQILAMLIAERDKLNRAIEALQGSAKRPGRPPKNAAAQEAIASDASAKPRKTRTAAQRKAQAKRMKDYWAKRKKAEKS